MKRRIRKASERDETQRRDSTTGCFEAIHFWSAYRRVSCRSNVREVRGTHPVDAENVEAAGAVCGSVFIGRREFLCRFRRKHRSFAATLPIERNLPDGERWQRCEFSVKRLP